LAYEHRIKADAINEKVFTNDSLGVYGISYEIVGNVASNYQFFLTDSTNNFYRGSLYFNVKPNIDSIKPVLDYLKENINTMIGTFDWK
ncbi:MAG: gliding motility lipoprotein GldD, partial [Flavobacteriales bacterium]